MPNILKDANIAAISLVDRGANLKKIFLYKRATGAAVGEAPTVPQQTDLLLHQPIIKAGTPGDEWSTIYCLVAVPGEVDQQGDVWEEDEIRKSAHDFVKSGALINFMHETLDPVGTLVESAIAPADMTVNGEHIRKGSWYIAVQPNDEMKSLIKSGEITGVSVQGSAQRVPVFTPGIDSPGTMLHTVSKNAARTMDGKSVKEGATVHLASDVNQAFIVLGEHPDGSGRLVISNVSGDHKVIHPLDLVTPQTAQAKLEQIQSEAPKPMSVHHNPTGESPFAAMYEQSEQASAGQGVGGEVVVKDARHPQTVAMVANGHGDVVEGVWKNIRGARVFIDTSGPKTGTITIGPDEIRGMSLEGLTKRSDLLPEQFAQPVLKDASGRQLYRGDRVSHVLNPEQSFQVVELTERGPVVAVEKDGQMFQSMFPARQVTYATGPVGGKGQFEDLVAALVDDYDDNEQLREALAQLGIQGKDQIEDAVQSGQLDEQKLRALVKLVDGPADSGDDANVEGNVAVGQGVSSHMFKSEHSIDALVSTLNEVTEVSTVEKAIPPHDPAKCAVGGCANCRKEGEGETDVEKAAEFVCKCDCDKCADGVCGCTKGKACESCEKDEEKTAELLNKGEAFPGAAPPFGKKKRKGEETGDVDDEGNQIEDGDLSKVVEAETDDVNFAPAQADKKKRKAFPGAAEPFGGGDEDEVTKHFAAGQPHAHPHEDSLDKKKPGRFPVAPPKVAPAAEPTPAGEQAAAATPSAEEQKPEEQAAPGPQLGDKPRPQLGGARRPNPFTAAPAEKAGFPPARTPDQPMGGKPGEVTPPEAPAKPKLAPEQRDEIIADLQQLAARGDEQTLAVLEELGVPADKLDAVDIPAEQLIALKEKLLTVGRKSQSPAAQAPGGFGVSADKADQLIGKMAKAVAQREGWPPQKPEELAGPKRLPSKGQNVVRGHGVRLNPEGAIIKTGGEVEAGKIFLAPDGQRYIAKSVTETTVIGFAGGEERPFPRGQVRAPSPTLRKAGEKAGERLPFREGLLGDEQAGTLTEGLLVEVPGGARGTVYEAGDKLVVVIVEEAGNLPRRREFKPSQVKPVIQKAGVKVGDFVTDSDGKAGEVVAVEDGMATLGYVAKNASGLEEKTREVSVDDLTVIIAKSAAGGSMGGHSPKAHGKIKYIVRSFGEWAGGKQSIAAKRLLAEHPEVVNGDPRRANALAAWLKDQWAGTTKWRGKRDGSVTKAVADEQLIYEELDFEVDEEFEPTQEELDAIFTGFAELLGHDPVEVEAVLETRSDDQVEPYLNMLFEGVSGEVAESATTSANPSATLDVSGDTPRRDGEAARGFRRVREVFTRALGDRQAGSAPLAREENILAAFESLADSLESTAGEDDVLTKRREALADFGRVIERV